MEISKMTKLKNDSNIANIKKNAPELDLSNPDAVVAWLGSKKYKLSTIRTKLCCIMAYHRDAGREDIAEKFRPIYKKITDDMLEDAKKQLCTESEKEKAISWPDICKIAEMIQEDESITPQARLLVAFYTDLIPVRADYIGLTVYSRSPRKDEGNYIVINKSNSYVKINDHKASKTSGPIVQKINDVLKAKIEKYIAESPAFEKLFDWKTSSSLSHHLINSFMKHCGKRVSVNVLRHAYITHFREGDKSLIEKSKVAAAMGHGLTMQEMYRRLDLIEHC